MKTKSMVIGIDLGDKENSMCVVNEHKKVIDERNVPNTKEALQRYLSGCCPQETLVVMEAGTHSPWVSRLVTSLGFETVVGDPRRMHAIWGNIYKTDRHDAELLARLIGADRALISPVRHRGEQAQRDLAVIKSREALISSRTALVNSMRGMLKALGLRLPKCSAASFHKKAFSTLPDELLHVVEPVIESIAMLTAKISGYDKRIEKFCCEKYPETNCLRRIHGVGPLTALAYILTLERTDRFLRSRQVGPYLGLVPKCDQSGSIDKQLRITKAGNPYLRKLLVGCAHYILGPFGKDCDLRRFGERLAERGGKNAKRRAVVSWMDWPKWTW